MRNMIEFSDERISVLGNLAMLAIMAIAWTVHKALNLWEMV